MMSRVLSVSTSFQLGTLLEMKSLNMFVVGELLTATNSKLFLSCIESALKSVISAEPEITRYDTIAGDGDAGLTLKSGAEGILNEISQNKISDSDVVAAMVEISSVVEKEMGGTSGGLYAILLSGLSKGLIKASKELDKDEATVEVWSRGLEVRLDSLESHFEILY